MMKVFRLAGFCRSKVFPFSLQKLKQVRFSSEPSPRCANSFTAQNDCEESLVYRHKLLFQRPITIRWQQRLYNSVSFIGRVMFPVKPVKCREFGVYTMLEVVSLRHAELPFRILLKMWGSMGEIASKHLKKLDLIYVSGHLGSYTKVDEKGKIRTFYEVNVQELNYVAGKHKNQTAQESENYEPKGLANPISSASDTEKSMDILYLWQVFFANPHEWWDNRKTKTNPRAPDFKHKDTRECLWLSPEDPPWVEKQLQLNDFKMAELGHPQLANTRAGVSILKYVD